MEPVDGNSNIDNSAAVAVQVTGGDFVGSSLASQDHHHELHLTKKDFREARFGPVIHHHYAASHEEPSQPGVKKSRSQEGTESGSGEKEWELHSNNIRIFNDDPICERSQVFRGEVESEITGKRKLAIKLIRFNAQNVNEAKMLVRLAQHRNVVNIFYSDAHYVGLLKYLYIAMELCHEKNLRQLIEDDKENGVPFDPVTMNSYVEQVIEGLKFIHEQGILHRDLKLDNLLLSLDKQFLKICDFGFSKQLKKLDHSVTQLSQIGIGTVGYMAPETLNDNIVSKMSDIFSLGIVIYALWSYGLHPFGNDPDLWNFNIKRGKNRDLSHILVPNKKDATDLLKKVLRFERRQRPTAEEIQKHEYFRQKDVETGPEATQGTNNTIIVFDRTSKHLHGYDPEKKTWKQLQAISDLMVEDGPLTAGVLHSHIYVMLRNKAVHRIDQTKLNSWGGAWERMADKKSDYGSVAVLNGFIYNGDRSKSSRTVEKYDPANDEWVMVANKDRECVGVTLVSAKGNLYAIGGFTTNHKRLRDVERFDPVTSTWSYAQPMNQARSSAAAVELDDKIYVMGGYGGRRLNSVECYDIDLDLWTMVASMKVARGFFSACVIGGKIYAVGGDGGDKSSTETIEMLDQEENEWKIVETLRGMELESTASVAVSLDPQTLNIAQNDIKKAFIEER